VVRSHCRPRRGIDYIYSGGDVGRTTGSDARFAGAISRRNFERKEGDPHEVNVPLDILMQLLALPPDHAAKMFAGNRAFLPAEVLRRLDDLATRAPAPRSSKYRRKHVTWLRLRYNPW